MIRQVPRISRYDCHVRLRFGIGPKAQRHLDSDAMVGKGPADKSIDEFDGDAVGVALRRHLNDPAEDQFDALAVEESFVDQAMIFIARPPPDRRFLNRELVHVVGHLSLDSSYP